MNSTMVRAGLVAFVVGAIAGCGGGGGGGDGGVAAPVVPAGPTLAAAPVPTGTAEINVGNLTADQFGALAPTVVVGGALVGSPPQVSFALQDANGNPIIGFGSTSQSATATVKSYPNLAFSIAKLVPGTNGAPSKWVSYIVTTVPTKNATTGAITDSAPTRPSTDNTGTLVDNGNGTYTYTFYRDITKAKEQVDAMTVSGTNNKADLGDLTYDANAVHRLTIAVFGNAPGTGTNTADGVQVTAGVPLKNPVNVVYDFIPATGQAATDTDPGRNIVATAKCNECHGKLGGTPGDPASSQPAAFHGSARNNTQYCVVCHTDQRRYGRTEATITGNTFTSSTTLVDGRAVGNFPNYIHKIHLAHYLTKQNYNYAGVAFNHITYPQPIKNCTKCHDGTEGAANKTAQGDNWKNVPNRLACGACHDGINFATGKGVTLADAREGLTTSQFGHVGGIQTDDSKCALCHGPTALPVYHVTIDPTGSSGRAGYPPNTATNTPTAGFPSGQGPSIALASQVGTLPEGIYKINFEIKQVTVAGAAGAKKATVIYRILKDGQPVTLNATGFLIDNVDGSPGVYVAYATTQDGIANPADWNATKSASVKALRDGTNGNSQTGPDANGFYTATLGATIPDDAKLVTAAVGVDYQGFVQLNHADYPNGIRLREPKFVTKVADGFTARRAIVDADKCNACHGQLGVSPSFHGGARNNGEGCAICHDANRATGHVGPNNSFGGGWSVASKSLIHGIHAASKREQAFTYEATAENLEGFGEVTFPGILKKCETCHVPGGYDFSGTANNAALPNLLWTTDAKGNMLNDATTNPTGITPIGLSPWVTTLGAGQIDYRTDNLVSSPIAASCFGCHDSTLAVQHMQSNGGTLVTLFSSVSSTATRPTVGTASTMTFTKAEQCTLCHLAGRVADIKAMHAK
ncbi:MAG: OmcA/MtrC family decaheme c-type cytochrome [Betaproteobacteria bacterium]|nr:MAG: OmcA/MtrC family decaheme c-type cytochrome [Betaproteobacteria bacterium]